LKKLIDHYKNCPIPQENILDNLALFIPKENFAKILFINEIYKKILDVPRIVIEFGVRWGHNLAVLDNLRDIYEPYNKLRKIVGFDTFEGFTSISAEDGLAEPVKEGSYNVTENYVSYLDELLSTRENKKQKHELVTGNAIYTLKDYLLANRETLIALAYFDFDLYKPTKECLKIIAPYLSKGSI
jgi:hypothetical protein